MTAETAARAGLLLCPACGTLNRRYAEGLPRRGACACACCGRALHVCHPRSLSRTVALLIAAALFYAPANLLPILETTSPFGIQNDTIMSGAVYMWDIGSWPLAIVILVASILIPLTKLLALALLVLSVHRRWRGAALQRARLYRLLERVGRWSMTDVFVAAVLATLVQLRGIAQIRVGPAAAAFSAVVVLTNLATLTFDPRLIWDPERARA
jgi:paraquat-inducible protein A